MSHPNELKQVTLSIDAGESATEIFVLDSQFQLKERGVGRLFTQQLPGVYKIKLRAGAETFEELVFLQGEPVSKQYSGLTFSSPIPLEGTARKIEAHVKAAERESREVHVSIGEGSWLFIFARDYSAGQEGDSDAPVTKNTARGLSLKSAKGETIVDLAESSITESGENPWAACSVQVEPGMYLLSQKMPGGEVLEQSVYAVSGWQTQIFIPQRIYERDSGLEDQEEKIKPQKVPDLSGLAILLCQERCFRPDDSYARLVELARLGLSNRRKVLSDELRQMLRYKFEHPMLGIYGAHLLLLEQEPDMELFQQVVKNLRGMLGHHHPDIEALSLATDDNESAYVFTVPPMLRRSWMLVVKASAGKQGLVPVESLSGEVADCFLGSCPWLTWLKPASAKDSDAPRSRSRSGRVEEQTDLEAALESLLLPGKYGLGIVQPLLQNILSLDDSAPTKILNYLQEALARVVGIVSTEYGATLDHAAKIRKMDLNLDSDQIKLLVESLGLPRENVEALLYKNAEKIQEKLKLIQKES